MYLIGSALACLVSIGCLVAGIRALVMQRRQREGSTSTTGVVVALQKRNFDPGSGDVYCPTVEFTTASGKTVQFDSAFGTMPASHKVGQTVKVFYDPENPESAEIDSGLTKWLAPGCFLAFAVGAFFFSIVFLGLFFVFANGN